MPNASAPDAKRPHTRNFATFATFALCARFDRAGGSASKPANRRIPPQKSTFLTKKLTTGVLGDRVLGLILATPSRRRGFAAAA
ncbi:MAG TPA: hypothetical protein VEZ48_05685 [Sphingomonadaceae bacterium]|nr:hypothetical protein [Sphingomonadaceae bacterium]